MISLQITTGESTRLKPGILKTNIVQILLTLIFSFASAGYCILNRYLHKYCSVNSASKISKRLTLNSDVFVVLGVVATLISALYLSASGFLAICIGGLVHIIWGVLIFWFSRLTFYKSEMCSTSLLEFHDFLIAYKSTPRSKILRRFSPNMEAVVEEPSIYE